MELRELRITRLPGIDQPFTMTAGPGLIGGLIVGVMTAKAICAARGIPLVAVNHLEGHALTPRLTDGLEFPYLLLLVSGGHTMLVEVRAIGDYHLLGETLDDAAGEAFDKTAKLLGLGYPGGAIIDRLAADGFIENRRGAGAYVATDLPPAGAAPGCGWKRTSCGKRICIIRLSPSASRVRPCSCSRWILLSAGPARRGSSRSASSRHLRPSSRSFGSWKTRL